MKKDKYLLISLLILGIIIIIFYNLTTKTYAYQYVDYEYNLFYKEDTEELKKDIINYISDIDYIIYNNSDYSIYENINENYEFMINFAIDYIFNNIDKYEDKIINLDKYYYNDKYNNTLSTTKYIDKETIFNITNKYFGTKDFKITNNNVNIIDNYISLSNNNYTRPKLNINSITINDNGENVIAYIKYDNDNTEYIYNFKKYDNILKIYNVEVKI